MLDVESHTNPFAWESVMTLNAAFGKSTEWSFDTGRPGENSSAKSLIDSVKINEVESPSKITDFKLIRIRRKY
jgi:hypothetical protein